MAWFDYYNNDDQEYYERQNDLNNAYWHENQANNSYYQYDQQYHNDMANYWYSEADRH